MLWLKINNVGAPARLEHAQVRRSCTSVIDMGAFVRAPPSAARVKSAAFFPAVTGLWPRERLAAPVAEIPRCPDIMLVLGPAKPRASLHDEITDKIIAELEAGRLPWVQPWGSAAATAPLALPKKMRPPVASIAGSTF